MESQSPPTSSRRPFLVVGIVAVVLIAAVWLLRSGRPPARPDDAAPTRESAAIRGECGPRLLTAPTAPADGDAWLPVEASARALCYDLTASDVDAAGVAPEAHFVLASAEPFTPEDLAARLEIRPAVELSILPAEGKAAPGNSRRVLEQEHVYELLPRRPLAEGQVYRVEILDAPGGRALGSWAFEVRRPLTVVGTLPADQATDVPTDAGIEIAFSHDGVTGAEERFRIEPAVEGRFEVHGRTLVFVPEALAPQTLYSVTLEAGATVAGSALALETPRIFRFETGGAGRDDFDGGPGLQFARRTWEARPGEVPVLALIGLGAESAPPTVPFSAYRYPDAAAFSDAIEGMAAVPAWTHFAAARATADTAGLTPVATFEAPLERVGDFGDLLVRFPEDLEPGYYLVSGAHDGATVQAWLQVTDLAPYVSLGRERVLVWVNDATTGRAVAGAGVRSFDGTLTGIRTGTDGVVLADVPEGFLEMEPGVFGLALSRPVPNVLVSAPDGGEAVVPLADVFRGFRSSPFRANAFPGDASLYWRFIYTDRHLYRPDDTVHFWGLVRDRENPRAGQELTVDIGGGGFESFDGQPATIARQTVTANGTGTFLGTLDFTGASPGYYSLEARVGDQVVASTYVEIRDFVKPAYKIDVTPSTPALFVGETMRFGLDASFFEGSPVPNLALDATLASRDPRPITTDARGHADLEYTAAVSSPGDPAYSPDEWVQAWITPARAEEGDIVGQGWTRVFRSGVYLETHPSASGATGTVTGTVYAVDLAGIGGPQIAGRSDYQGAPQRDRGVAAEVVRITWRATPTGSTYDFVDKQVRTTYSYEPVRTPVGAFGATSDAGGGFRIDFPVEAGASYDVMIEVEDDSGRAYRTQTSVYAGAPGGPGSIIPYLSIDGGQEPFAVGERVEVTMRRDDAPLPSGGGNRYLFYRGQNGILDYTLEDESTYRFAFESAHIPSVSVLGVRFTGSTYQETPSVYGGIVARFDPSSRRLEVRVTADKPRYEPGDTATLDVAVTDAGGRPAAAEVLLSAVDEAIFRLQGPEFGTDLGILAGLYQPVGAGILGTYASHQVSLASQGAEFGGGGDGGRSDFKDVALFERVTTDAEGRARVTFTMPDNLTSWRVASLAVTPDLYAGSATTLVPVGLPFFVDLAMGRSYLARDRPSVRVRAFGTDLRASEPVTFEVSAPGLLAVPIRTDGVAFDPVDVPLGALREGAYTLTVRAASGRLADAVERRVEVVGSRVARRETAFLEVGPGASVPIEAPGTGTVDLRFADHNRGRLLPALEQIAWTVGDRLDQRLARSLAEGLVGTAFGDGAAAPSVFPPAAYQTEEGGLALLPFGDADLDVSALVALTAPGAAGRQALVGYFRGIVDDPDSTRERAIAALAGLAGLGEPVLDELRRQAAATDLTPLEALHVGLGAAALGDHGTAGAQYGAVVRTYGERRGAAARLHVGDEPDTVLRVTVLAAVLGARLGDGLAPLFFAYTTENAARDTVIALEQVAYTAAALPHLPAEPVTFAFTVGGERREASLAGGRTLRVHLARDDLAALDLVVGQGTLGVSLSALGPVEPPALPDAGDAVAVTRLYDGEATGPIAVAERDLVRIELDARVTAGPRDACHQLTDLLPSGLVAVSRPYQPWFDEGLDEEAAVDWPYAIEGQRVSFCVTRTTRIEPIRYYARVLGLGDYLAEPAMRQSMQAPEDVGWSAPLEVEIR